MDSPDFSTRRKLACAAVAATALAVLTGPALAHVSEQAFVLLLPTGIYTAAGVATVAVTVLAVALLPPQAVERIFARMRIQPLPRPRLATATSLASTAFLGVLVVAGLTGSRDPLSNPLPLVVWTVFWITLVTLHSLVGDLWRWLNPWTGLCRLLEPLTAPPPLRYPQRLGTWPAVIGLFLFSAFYLADIAPDDPARLAVVVACYWLFTLVAALLFGPDIWLQRGECLTVLMRAFARLAPLRRTDGGLWLGFFGHRVVHGAVPSLSLAVFIISLLATGSFDGLNETFLWLAWLGINPLEFPGRSAVYWQTVAGLAASYLLLVALFAVTVQTGVLLAGEPQRFGEAFRRQAAALLPIAAGYHLAHYLTAFLVNGQYAIAAASDPLSNGSDLLGLGQFYVTTGFFNTRDTVRAIWLTQAGAVVLGHVVAVLVSHAAAARMWTTRRQVALGQAPLAVLMILYTLFGLWLLAAPRGA